MIKFLTTTEKANICLNTCKNQLTQDVKFKNVKNLNLLLGLIVTKGLLFNKLIPFMKGNDKQKFKGKA